jgi:hypothetical protein
MDTEGKEEAVFPFRAGRFANVYLMAVCTENLNPNIVVMKPAEDRV